MNTTLFLWLWGPAAATFVIVGLRLIDRYFQRDYEKRQKARTDKQ